jgi:ketosteroid isomerase-like protein
MGATASKRGGDIDVDEALRLSDIILSAWNEQDVEKVISCYTEDCIYLDPNTRGPVVGHDALRRYLTRLFQRWRMHWTRREFFTFADGSGTAFLWQAQLTPASGGKTAEIDGMDLALVRDGKLCRNEVYFDRMALFSDR